MKSTTYIFGITTQKNEKYLSENFLYEKWLFLRLLKDDRGIRMTYKINVKVYEPRHIAYLATSSSKQELTK